MKNSQMSDQTTTPDEFDERLPITFATQQKRLVCIEFPGYINNISKCLNTLGGETQINSTLKDPLRRLGISFRPNDPYCHQGFGDKYPVTDLLMKVKRKTRKINGKDEIKYECEILGIIDTVIKFKGLMDFQYLAPDIPDLLNDLCGSEILDISTPLHIPPPVFCRLDHPFDYQYKSDPGSKSKKPAIANDQSLGATLRKPRPSMVISCNFHVVSVPDQPKEGAEELLKRFNNDGLDIVEHMFNIRPIWSKRAIICHMGEKANRVKYVLPCVAYYWIGGPWRTFWTKFGYDPRKNAAAKIYQKLDFRLRSKKDLRNMKLLPPVSRVTSEFSFTTRFQKNVKKPVIPLGVESSSVGGENASTSTENTTSESEFLPYAFYTDRPPAARQMIYHLCDLRCSEIQRLISANDGKERECTESDGWLEPGTLENIRKLMTEYMTQLCQKSKGRKGIMDASSGEPVEDIEEEVGTFLDTLMDDEDVETYDILGDEEF